MLIPLSLSEREWEDLLLELQKQNTQIANQKKKGLLGSTVLPQEAKRD